MLVRRLADVSNSVRHSGLASAWAFIFVGFTLARVLGFVFSVAATRLLTTEDFGRFTYALTLSTVVSVFLSTVPVGLSGYLVRTRDDPATRQSYYTNWLLAVGLLLVASVVVTPFVGRAAGIGPLLVVGMAANQVGIAVLETYREVQRGADLFLEMSISYVLANLLQLVVVLMLGSVGIHSPGVFLVVYGLAPFAMFVLMEAVRPAGLGVNLASVSRVRLLEIARFAFPLSLQSICFTLWFSADVLLLQRTVSLEALGHYAVAKTMALVVAMPAITLASVVGPRAAVLEERAFLLYLAQMVGLTAGVTLPLALGAGLFGRAAVSWIFGARYQAAAEVLPWLALGMAVWGAYQVASRLWIGYGKPTIDLGSTFAGMLVTLVVGVIAVPRLELTGAALAFLLGSLARLLVVAGYSLSTSRAHHRGTPPGDRPV